MRSYANSRRAFVPFARAYYDDPTIIYRHVVPAAFDSKMGSALVTARLTAKVIMWWVHRDARYIRYP